MPPLAAKAGIIFFVAVYTATQFLFDTGLHYLHVLAILFVVVSAMMLLIGRLKPMEEVYTLPREAAVNIVPWKSRYLYYGLLLMIMVGMFILFPRRGSRGNNRLYLDHLYNTTAMCYRNLTAMIFSSCLLCAAPAIAQQAELVIPLGNKSRIVYDLDRGQYNITWNGKIMIKEAYAAYQAERPGDSRKAGKAAYKVSDVHTSLGKARLYTISFEGDTSPQQLFYILRGNNSFITQLRLQHRAAAASMTPLADRQPVVEQAGRQPGAVRAFRQRHVGEVVMPCLLPGPLLKEARWARCIT